jgi:hypothetical protein
MSSRNERAAQVLITARARRSVLPTLPDDVRPRSAADAYAIQDAVADAIGPIGGWKVGAKDAVAELAPDGVRAGLDGHLDTLTRKQLVRPHADAHVSYRFNHILIRDAAYQGLLKRTRATLHERFVDWADRVNRDRDRQEEPGGHDCGAEPGRRGDRGRERGHADLRRTPERTAESSTKASITSPDPATSQGPRPVSATPVDGNRWALARDTIGTAPTPLAVTRNV